jgi:antitoxin ParD1/3/4
MWEVCDTGQANQHSIVRPRTSNDTTVARPLMARYHAPIEHQRCQIGAHKQSVSFTEQAFAHVQALVEAGEYPNISAAASGELARARAWEHALSQAEVHRGLTMPVEKWEAVGRLTDDARGGLTA